MTKLILSIIWLLNFCLLGSMALGQTQSINNYKYISPKPGSKFINPENTISIRQGEKFDTLSVHRSLISVSGSKSGEITGSLTFSSDFKTLIFHPDKPYFYKEIVTVKLQSGIMTKSGLEMEGLSFDFKIKDGSNLELLKKYYDQYVEIENTTIYDQQMKETDNYPQGFPLPTVIEYDNPAPGYTFINASGIGIQTYYEIIDNYGTPVFYRKPYAGAQDFKFARDGILFLAETNYSNPTHNKYLLMDSKFNIFDTLRMGNGYNVDFHDMLLLENGNYILMAYDPQLIDMSQIVPGGDPNATVTGLVLQELDAEDNVIFQWRSWDNFDILDATHEDFTASVIDYVHGNALEVDAEGNIFLSCRHMDEITKIDRASGDVIWRLGLHAINNMFEFTNDTIGFWHQHDIRLLPNGNITLFDNGILHNPKFSQAAEYELDEENFTAKLVWNYVNDPVIIGYATGSTQRLDNGNTLIGWGRPTSIHASEVTIDKNKTWEFFVNKSNLYRALKYDFVTDYFETNVDTIDFGVYNDDIPWPSDIIITNNSDDVLQINSISHHTSSYNIETDLPLTIPASENAILTINFFPTQQGQIDDVLTLKYESFYNDSMPQMIARQVFLTGYVMDENAPVATLIPADGSIDIALGSQIKIHFNEPVIRSDGSVLKTADIPEIILLKENDSLGADVQYAAYIDAWKQQIVITPELKSKQQYYVELLPYTVADGSGNVLIVPAMSSFITEDAEAPEVQFFPLDSAVDVNRNVIVTLTFNEKIYHTDGTEINNEDLKDMVIYKENNSPGEEIEFVATIDEEKTLITIYTNEHLDAFKKYNVVLPAYLIQDDASNIVQTPQTIIFTTGDEFRVDENIRNEQVDVFPNPSSGRFNIQFNNSDSKEILIYNITGNLVYFKTRVKQDSFEIDIFDLPAGLYFIKLKNLINNSVGEIKVLKY